MNYKSSCKVFQKLFTACFLMILVGCGTRDLEVRNVRVEVPVLVPCKSQEVAVPPWAAAGLQKDDSLEVKLRSLLAERRQRIGYEKQLIAVITACQ